MWISPTLSSQGRHFSCCGQALSCGCGGFTHVVVIATSYTLTFKLGVTKALAVGSGTLNLSSS